MNTYERFRNMTVLVFFGLIALAILAFLHVKLCDAEYWHWLLDCSGKESEEPSPFITPSSLEELFEEFLTTLPLNFPVIRVPVQVMRVITEIKVKEVEVTRIVAVTSETDRSDHTRQTAKPTSTPLPATNTPSTIKPATETTTPVPMYSPISTLVPLPVTQMPTATSSPTPVQYHFDITADTNCEGWSIQALSVPNDAEITYEPAQSGFWDASGVVIVVITAHWPGSIVKTETAVLRRPEGCQNATPTPTSTPTPVPTNMPTATATASNTPTPTLTATVTSTGYDLRVTGSVSCRRWEVEAVARPEGASIIYDPAQFGRWNETDTVRVLVQAQWPDGTVKTERIVLRRPDHCATETAVPPTPTPTPTATQPPTVVPSSTPTVVPSYTPTATATPPMFSCPLEYVEGRIVVLFAGENIRSDKGENDATAGPFSITIPAGSYTVTLVSYDNHSSGTSSSQPKESWHVILNNQDGLPIAATGSISDLPDDQDWLIEVVSDDLELEEEATSVVAVHSAYPDRSSPNSIVPVCAAFDE